LGIQETQSSVFYSNYKNSSITSFNRWAFNGVTEYVADSKLGNNIYI
jgi:hypothetical protein